MTEFRCRSCGAAVTGELTELTEVPVPRNAPAESYLGNPAPRIPSGGFAIDPEPFGPPYLATAGDPHVHVSGGPRGTILVNPDDARRLALHPDRRRRAGCCRLDGLDGPNLVCAGCGIEIATEQSDCWVSWHDVRLEPSAVVRSDGPADAGPPPPSGPRGPGLPARRRAAAIPPRRKDGQVGDLG